MTFVWSSERSNYQHLRRVSVRWTNDNNNYITIAVSMKPKTGEEPQKRAKLSHDDDDDDDGTDEGWKANTANRAIGRITSRAMHTADIVDDVQLTDGRWTVDAGKFVRIHMHCARTRVQLSLSTDRQHVYFTGRMDTPLEAHIYHMQLMSTGICSPQRVTRLGYTHSCLYADRQRPTAHVDCRMLVAYAA